VSTLNRPLEVVYEFRGPRHRCAYCGELPDTIDHTTPQWFVSGNHRLISRYLLYKVASCGSCNVLAGQHVDRTFEDRKQRIATKLAKRAKKLLETGNWTEEELATLGRTLQDLCRDANAKANVVRRRLAHLADPTWPPDAPDELQKPDAYDGPRKAVQGI